MGGGALPTDKKFAISTNWGTFRGENAMSVTGQMRLSENVVVNGGVAAGFPAGRRRRAGGRDIRVVMAGSDFKFRVCAATA